MKTEFHHVYAVRELLFCLDQQRPIRPELAEPIAEALRRAMRTGEPLDRCLGIDRRRVRQLGRDHRDALLQRAHQEMRISANAAAAAILTIVEELRSGAEPAGLAEGLIARADQASPIPGSHRQICNILLR